MQHTCSHMPAGVTNTVEERAAAARACRRHWRRIGKIPAALRTPSTRDTAPCGPAATASPPTEVTGRRHFVSETPAAVQLERLAVQVVGLHHVLER
jgi:hypothetical protein